MMTAVNIFRCRRHAARRAFTLIEMMVVIGIVLILAAIAIPSLSGLTEGSSESAARTMVRGLFNSVRARATNKQEYAAVRFQQDAEGKTYAIVLEPARMRDGYVNYANGYLIDPYNGMSHALRPDDLFVPDPAYADYLVFVAANDVEPIKFPRGIELASGDIISDSALNNADSVRDATTFTVVFSPSGQVLRRRVFVSQRWYGLVDPTKHTQTYDTLFNDIGAFTSGSRAATRGIRLDSDPSDMRRKDYERAIFLQPDTDKTGPNGRPRGLGPELSQVGFVFYDRQRRIDAVDKPFSGYVQTQGSWFTLNVYTGGLIDMPQ